MFAKKRKLPTTSLYVRSITKKNHKFIKLIAGEYGKTVSDVINKAIDLEREKYERRKNATKTNS